MCMGVSGVEQGLVERKDHLLCGALAILQYIN
jgi:hypothetical protein